MEKKTSAYSGFHKLLIKERLKVLSDFCDLSYETIQIFEDLATLAPERLVAIGENPISNYELPLRLVNYFQINKKWLYVPIAVEEASVVAGACYASKVCGEVSAKVDKSKSYVVGQVQLIEVTDPEKAKNTILENKRYLLDKANEKHNFSRAYDLEVKEFNLPLGKTLVVNLFIDPGDAMGTAVASEMGEVIAPELTKLTGYLYNARIISNYSGRLTWAEVRIPLDRLARETKTDDNKTMRWSGEEVRDRILWLYQWAEEDPDRAVTHNKGIMNGVDGVALATGNDWRAVEIANARYAQRTGQYKPLSKWYSEGDFLVGELEMLIPCGIVGGEIKRFPKAEKIIKEVLKVRSADELAEIMAGIGLVQNYAALSMLATIGISKGHRPFR
ncbi:MAG: 3-hydroxy-3-methylglutaryl-CoA reductase [Candidatus Aenigmarchaeota archaeon]|nr:3-hydroxy-3-methylglutaryl-CoA reductase [Candidatus Aenigmarchaeota archaeon]